MEYRAVGNRCAVILDVLNLPISHEEALNIIKYDAGFFVVDIDLVMLARRCIGISQYRRGALYSDAPRVVDCSSFVKWLYGQRGVWLPRRTIQQCKYGEAINVNEIIAGDVVFTSGWIDWYDVDPVNGIGHAGIATGEGTIVHALSKEAGVVEEPLESFLGNTKRQLRGVRRYISKDVQVLTLEAASGIEVETSDDIRWLILQWLPK